MADVDVDAVMKSAIAQAKAELLKEFGSAKDEFQKTAHAVTGIIPQVAEVVKTDTATDQATSTDDLLGIIKNLYAEMEQLKRQAAGAASQLASNAAVDFAQGGEPVPHNLQLDDGSMVQNFPGIATHYSDANGTRRVIAAYPVAPVEARS